MGDGRKVVGTVWAVEHLIVVIAVLIWICVPSRPSRVRLAIAREQYRPSPGWFCHAATRMYLERMRDAEGIVEENMGSERAQEMDAQEKEAAVSMDAHAVPHGEAGAEAAAAAVAEAARDRLRENLAVAGSGAELEARVTAPGLEAADSGMDTGGDTTAASSSDEGEPESDSSDGDDDDSVRVPASASAALRQRRRRPKRSARTPPPRARRGRARGRSRTRRS